MSRSLRLGFRLAVRGGREGLVRLVFMATGVGIGVALLLLALIAPQAVRGRSERMAWQDAAYVAVSPESTDDPLMESADGALFLAVSDYFDGRPMTRAYLAAVGDDPPTPPGLARAPGPGEVAVSPALRRLLENTADDELRARFPGRVTMTIGPEGLAHDNDLVGIIGRTPDQLRDVGSVAVVHGFRQLIPTGWAIVAVLSFLLLSVAVLLLVPVVLLIVLVTRVAWRQRERRLAAIRLAGATQRQISLIAAAEAGTAAVGGAVLGLVLYEVGRRILVATVTVQGGHFWLDDSYVPRTWLAAVLLGTPLLVVLTAVVALRHVHARPLSVHRQSRRRHPSPWLAVPLIVGLGGQFLVLPFRGSLAAPTADGQLAPYSTIVVLLTMTTLIGFVVIGPWLVGFVGRGVARLSRSVPGLLAARRIAADPGAIFGSVSAVGLAVVALTYLGCTVAVNPALVDAKPWTASLRPGVVLVSTGGVPETAVAPLLTGGAVAIRPSGGDATVACAELARVRYVTCPYLPESGFAEPGDGGLSSTVVSAIYLPTDGSLAAENRVRTRAANLVPNAIINSDRDPVDYQLETYLRDFDRLGAVAAFFVVVVGAFGLTAAMVGGIIERRRPFALLRASGVHLGELRRAVFLETAVTMAATTVVGAAVGVLLAFLSSRQSDVDWRWPGLELAGYLMGGVMVALLFSTIALPLLSLTTRYDAVHVE